MNNKIRKNQLMSVMLISFTVLGIIFMYRFLILHEVREYDLRPLLKIKNGDPNFLSTYFTACIPLTIYRYRQSQQLHQSFFYVLLAGFFLLCTIMNQSRMGIIALVTILLLLAGMLKWERKMILISLASVSLFLSSLFSFGDKILTRFINMSDASNMDRLKTLNAGYRTFLKSPWFGVGWNQSSEYYYQFSEFPAFQSAASPYEVHNTILKIVCETGILGLMLYVFFISVIAKAIVKNYNRDKELAVMNMAIVLGLMINSMTISAGYKEIYILWMILIYIVCNHDGMAYVFISRGLTLAPILGTKILDNRIMS
ncbi:MAG: O-antigen ligase family protein [Bdellovibrio sp.]|nr:O-antigen ligase family protein [Bdellovibrio sp.]